MNTAQSTPNVIYFNISMVADPQYFCFNDVSEVIDTTGILEEVLAPDFVYGVQVGIFACGVYANTASAALNN
jgi:hypothetical protein